MKLEPNIPDPDGFYAALVAANDGLDAEHSALFMSRLALLLSNQIGDQRVLLDCIAAARKGVDAGVRIPQSETASPGGPRPG